MSEFEGPRASLRSDPRRGELLITLARVATRGGPAPYSAVRSEERQ